MEREPILTIEDGFITLQLSPFQCVTLAKACRLAGEQSCEAEIDEWRTFAALFQACATAGFCQWHLPTAEAELLRAQLRLARVEV